MVMEFPHSEPVQKLLLKACLPQTPPRADAHLFERRDRAYCRPTRNRDGFNKQALDEAIDDAGGDDRCAAEGLKLAAVPVREKSRLYGTRSSKPTRKKAFDEDRGLDPLKAKFPTICVNGVRIQWGKDESEEMRIPNEAILFIRTPARVRPCRGLRSHSWSGVARGPNWRERGGSLRRSDPSARSRDVDRRRLLRMWGGSHSGGTDIAVFCSECCLYWIGNFRVWLLALAGVSPFLEGPVKR